MKLGDILLMPERPRSAMISNQDS